MPDVQDHPQHVLVVDDSVETLGIVKHTLEKAGFQSVLATSGEEALKLMGQLGLPHAAIVDLNMPPGMDGFEFCDTVLQFCDLPIIMLTAADEADTIVQGIEHFAEDYVIKPFNPNELTARLRRVLQRMEAFPYPMTPLVPVDDTIKIDFSGREAVAGSKHASLTPTEAKLLYILMRADGETVATDYVLRRIWPQETVYEDRLHVHVHRLRRKLSIGGKDHQYVVSERGVGYRFQPNQS